MAPWLPLYSRGSRQVCGNRAGDSAARAAIPEALGALQKAEIEKWWPIIKAADIKPE
jgi:hypothetical protein